jgi:hypothetical protein
VKAVASRRQVLVLDKADIKPDRKMFFLLGLLFFLLDVSWSLDAGRENNLILILYQVSSNQ